MFPTGGILGKHQTTFRFDLQRQFQYLALSGDPLPRPALKGFTLWIIAAKLVALLKPLIGRQFDEFFEKFLVIHQQDIHSHRAVVIGGVSHPHIDLEFAPGESPRPYAQGARSQKTQQH
jgi:hypothetical protein